MPRETRNYGTEEGEPLEAVCRHILRDALGEDAPLLRVVGGATGMAILPWIVEKRPQTLPEALALCRQAANAAGWELLDARDGYVLVETPWHGPVPTGFSAEVIT